MFNKELIEELIRQIEEMGIDPKECSHIDESGEIVIDVRKLVNILSAQYEEMAHIVEAVKEDIHGWGEVFKDGQ